MSDNAATFAYTASFVGPLHVNMINIMNVCTSQVAVAAVWSAKSMQKKKKRATNAKGDTDRRRSPAVTVRNLWLNGDRENGDGREGRAGGRIDTYGEQMNE